MYSSHITGALAQQRCADRIARAEHERLVRLATGPRVRRFRISLRRRQQAETGHVVLRPVFS